MRLPLLALVAASAAFLVPPELSEADEGIFRALPVATEASDVPSTAFSQSISMPCLHCKGRDSHLQLDFAVADGSRLTLNGFELYPNADPWAPDLQASVVRASGKTKERTLGYTLSVEPEFMDQDQQMQVIDVKLQIVQVGTRFVDGVPSVKVKLIKSPNDGILIASIDLDETPDTAAACSSLWCHAKEMVKGAFRKAKACGRHGHKHHGHGHEHGSHHNSQDSPHHGHDWLADQGDETDETGHGHGHGHKHHEHGHKHDSKKHRVIALWKNVGAYIFLPVLMGITAGIGVALYVFLLQPPSRRRWSLPPDPVTSC